MSRRNDRRPNVLPALAEPERAIPRRVRVEGQLLAELLAVLQTLEDPRLNALVVTRVQVTDDLQLAKVYVHTRVGTDGEDDQEQAIMRGLKSAAGRLRRHVGRTLQLRYTPQLRFYYDHGVNNSRRVAELLDEIAREDAQRENSE